MKFTSSHVHPDGVLLGLGSSEGTIFIYDIKEQTIAATFEGHAGKVTSLEFSENGYYLAATSSDESLIRIWDLRKLSNIHSIELEHFCAEISWDHSGQYLSALVGEEVKIYLNKHWSLVTCIKVDKHASTLKFAQDASFLAIGASNGKVYLV